jgi:hypothetical protein
MSPSRVAAAAGLLTALLALPAASQTQTAPTTAASPAGRQTRPPAILASPEALRAAAARRPRIGAVDWQAAVLGARRSQGNTEFLGKLDRGEIDETRVPILLPADGGVVATARLYSFSDYYTISADLPGLGVSLTGTTSTVALPTRSPLTVQTQNDELLTVQRTVDGQLASFVRFGVLYTVEIRCDDPKDARCRSETLVRDLTGATNRVVLGRAARQAAGLEG